MTPEEVLRAAGLPEVAVRHIAPYAKVLDPEELTLELKALEGRDEVGKPPVIVYRGSQSLLVNWRKVVFEALPATAGGAAALAAAISTGDVLSGAAAVAGLAGGLALLIGATEVELGEDHGSVVIALWVCYEKTNPVPRAALTKSLPNVDTDRIDDAVRDLAQLQVIGFGDEGAIVKLDELILKPGG